MPACKNLHIKELTSYANTRTFKKVVTENYVY